MGYNYFECRAKHWNHEMLWDMSHTIVDYYDLLHENLVVKAATCPDFERRDDG
jgi:hypothetical protein